MPGVQLVEAAGEVVAAGGQIERRADGGDTADDFAGGGALLAGPLEQRIAAQRNAGGMEQAVRAVCFQAAQDPVDLGGITGVVGAWLVVEFARSAAKMGQRKTPAARLAGGCGRAGIVAARTALQAVKEYQQRRIGGSIEVVDIDEIAIRSRPALAAQGDLRRFDQQRPEGLGVAAG